MRVTQTASTTPYRTKYAVTATRALRSDSAGRCVSVVATIQEHSTRSALPVKGARHRG
jgi:hypothetical protein